jgi:hypothetical protein
MEELYARHPFASALVLGDNAYKDKKEGLESGHPGLFDRRIKKPYGGLIEQGVKFFAVLGNHDVKGGNAAEQLKYWNEPPLPHFYSFKRGPKGSETEFFAIDTTMLMPGAYGCYKKNPEAAAVHAREQLRWLEKSLAESTAPMKVVFGHYPLFSQGALVEHERAQTQEALEKLLAPMFEKYGVNLYLAGHEHHYEKPKEVNGVHYAVSGAAGELENKEEAAQEGSGLIRQCHFMEFEITPQGLEYHTISEHGKEIDSGLIRNKERPAHRVLTIVDPWEPKTPRLQRPSIAPDQSGGIGAACSAFATKLFGCFQAIASCCPRICPPGPRYRALSSKDEAYMV